MATSAVEICRDALRHVGSLKNLQDFNEQSEEARLCSEVYPAVLSELLSMHPWGFAERRAGLAVISEVEVTGWGYAYALPADFLIARRLWNGLESSPPDLEVRYELHRDPTHGTVLLTSASPATLLYTALVDDPPRFPALFKHALGLGVASRLAYPLAHDKGLMDGVETRYFQARSQAIAADLNSRRPAAEPESHYKRARRL